MKCGIVLIYFVAVGILVSACSHFSETADSSLTPSELNKNPSYYEGHEVVVRGYVTIVPEGHNIYESRQLSDEFASKWNSGAKDFKISAYEKYCLTIENPEVINPSGRKFERRTMIVSGKFVAHYLHDRFIDLAACPLPTAIIVNKVISSENPIEKIRQYWIAALSTV